MIFFFDSVHTPCYYKNSPLLEFIMKNLSKIFTACCLGLLIHGGLAHAQSISSKTTLSISIKGVPEGEQTRVSGQYVVSPDGYVFLPLLKNGIKASGLSSSALARNIEAAYRGAEMYKNPRITVISTNGLPGLIGIPMQNLSYPARSQG